MSERPINDLTEPERTALMESLHRGRDHFAGHRPRVAEWYHRRLVELAEDREAEWRIIQAAELDLAGTAPGVAEIVADDEGDD